MKQLILLLAFAAVSWGQCGSIGKLIWNPLANGLRGGWDCTASSTAPGTAGGLNTQMQYNNSGALGGTTGMTWNGSALTMPDGAIGAASLNWTHTGGGTLGFYKFSNTELGFPDQSIRFIDSGDTRRFLRVTSGNWDVSQTIHASFDLSFYNASGPGSGNIVALLSDTNLLFGPFSGGALNTGIVRDDADGILNISDAGLALQPVKFATQSPGDSSTKGATTAFVTAAIAAAPTHTVTFVFNGGTSVLTTGTNGLYPGSGAFSGTINRVDISGGGTAGAACSITVDIWKANAAIPTSGGKISASAPVTLSTATLAQSMDISTWTKAVVANDVFGASVATVTGCITATVQIWYK